MADIVVSVASKMAEYLVAPIGRQCGYVMSYDSYVRQLEDEVEKLENARERLQHSVFEAQNNLKPIKAEVKEWLRDTETIASKARDTLEHDGRAKKTCFCRCNLKEHYRLAREARRTVQDIQALMLQSQFAMVHTIIEWEASTLERQASILEKIMNALDDEKHKVIGVYGPGGVGKTSLLEKVERKLKREGRPFNMIVKATVSQTPDLTKIQDDIAYALSLNLKSKQSQQGRRDLLSQRLQRNPNEKVLIILDDLWDEIDLKAVGIPLGDESSGCKLLLTSRFRDVLERKMCADQTFRLEGLNNDKAFRLFEKTVGDKLKDDEELKAIAAQLVEKLAGLPLLIISVASTLKNSDVSAWKNALTNIEDSNIETIVKWSYNHLDSEDTKSLFLLCGLIGGTIQVEILLELGMGLGLFEGFNNTIQNSRDRLNMMLDELRSVCLLSDGGDDKDNVTIHDVYCEVVISTPFRGQNTLMMKDSYGSWSKEKLEKCWAKLEKCWAISLVDVGSDWLVELKRCRFPDLKVLMLSKQHDMGDCSRLDFAYMKELRVLYLCSMHITSLPSSIEILENLRSLNLDHCHVEDVAILGKLKALQTLSFAGSRISRLPKEIGELTKLRSLNLSNCNTLEIIEPGVLKRLIKLEELHMKESFDRWMGKHEIPLESCNVRLAELKSLTKLTSLKISIREPIILLEDDNLAFGNLIRFWINIGNVEGREFEGLRTMKLKLEGCDHILSIEWVQKALQETQYLYLCKLSEFKRSAHELCTQEFRELKYLDIDDSPSLKYIANSSDGLPLVAFTKLESLFLENLINLEKIYHGTIAPECFSKLKAVSVRQCDRLKYLWRLSDMQRLVQLEEIEVQKCDSMQSIVTHDAREDIVSADDRVELLMPNVRRLVLCELPNMTSFCARAEITSEDTQMQVSFPRLESLVTVGLLDLENILYGQPPFKYSNLKLLEISELHSLLSILKSDWIQKLPNLMSLNIHHCRSAEVVFDLEEVKVTRDVKILSRLTKLTLQELPNLQHMWKRDVQLQGMSTFQNLKELLVSNTRLTYLFKVSMVKCLRQIRDIKVVNCRNMEAVIVDEEGRDEGTYDIEFPLLKQLCISGCLTKKFFSYPHGKKSSVTTSNSKDTYSDSFFDRKVSLPSLEELDLNLVGSFKRIWHGELPKSSFNKLATLNLQYCFDLLDVFPSTIIERLHNLKSVNIFQCPSVESLFDCGSLNSNTESKIALLPKLDTVSVNDATRLRHMVKSDSQMVLSLPSLKDVNVVNCLSLRYIFPSFTAITLEKLECLYISHCEQMKEVVTKEEGSRSKAELISFPSLKSLSIRWCRNFGAFISSPRSIEKLLGETAKEDDELLQPLFNEMVIFPNMRSLIIEGTQCRELWNDQMPMDSFCKLEYLKLDHCDNLLHIAPSHMWRRLRHCLEILEVSSCRLIEIIDKSNGKVEKSSKLRRLILRDLYNLRRIWEYDGVLDVPFPNLRFIEAQWCPRLEMLFATFTADFLSQIKELVVESCENVELIAGHEECEESNSTTITFAKLTALRLFQLPKFRSFLPEKYCVEFPSLQVFSRVSCGTEPDQGFDGRESRRGKTYEFYEG